MEKLLELIQFLLTNTFSTTNPINLLFFILIASLFLLGVIVVSKSTLYTRKGIKRGLKILEGTNFNNIDERYFILENAFKSDEFYKEQWREFDETLRKLVINDVTSYYNTAEVSHFLNSDTLYYKRFASGFYFILPTVLTGLGILGTFVGLVFGLQFFSGVDFANTESVAKASEGLLSGIGASFITSVWGLFFSILLNLIYSRQESITEKRISAFTDKIEGLFPRHISAEGEGLFEIKKELEKHTTALESFSTKLANAVTSALEEGINRSLAPTIEKMAGVMEKFSTEKTENVSHMVHDFKDSLTSAAQQEMENLKETLKTITESLNQSNSTFSGMLSSWQNKVTEQNNLSENQQKMMESLSSNLEKLNTSSLAMGGITDQQKNVLGEFTEVIKNVERLSNIISPLTQVLEMANSASEKYTQTAQLMDNSSTNFLEAINQNSNLIQIQKQTLNELLPISNQFKSIIDQLRSPINDISKTISDLNNIEKIKYETYDKIDNMTYKLNEFIDKVNEHEVYVQNLMTQFQSTNNSAQNIWNSYRSSIEAIQNEIDEGIVRYTDTMRNKTEETFKVYDEALSSGLENISRSITELVESFESLGDKLDELSMEKK
ncbi:MAG: anti-phage defense ZorAB system ZorA [Ignavibacteriales bacterium]|nr:anti-phage defense ZorAB system ZorA [Ignavibacteriales bacterium]